MFSEKEYHVVKALVDEEVECFRGIDCAGSSVMVEYIFTLSDILEKVKENVEAQQREFLPNDSISIG